MGREVGKKVVTLSFWVVEWSSFQRRKAAWLDILYMYSTVLQDTSDVNSEDCSASFISMSVVYCWWRHKTGTANHALTKWIGETQCSRLQASWTNTQWGISCPPICHYEHCRVNWQICRRPITTYYCIYLAVDPVLPSTYVLSSELPAETVCRTFKYQ
jgi:hypothetical protein